MPPKAVREHQSDPVKSLLISINLFLAALDRYSEEEILDVLPTIERKIENLPIDDSVKLQLCDILWTRELPLAISLRTITTLLSTLSYRSYIN